MRRQVIQGADFTLSYERRTLVMGILNLTPDSFSDGGRYLEVERALAQVEAMMAAGMDILDVGGESTRPNHQPVSAAEEWARLEPFFSALRERGGVRVPISIDTYKAEVAHRAIESGAGIINDVWGLKRDAAMAEVAAAYRVPIILMHNREKPEYEDLMRELIADLQASVQSAIRAGVKEEKIVLDPGIGFGKTYEQNLEVMRRLPELTALGYPVLLGTSRKSIVGNALGLPPEDRLEGTAATVAYGIAQGCHIVRVHDVKEMKRVCAMMDAMLYG